MDLELCPFPLPLERSGHLAQLWWMEVVDLVSLEFHHELASIGLASVPGASGVAELSEPPGTPQGALNIVSDPASPSADSAGQLPARGRNDAPAKGRQTGRCWRAGRGLWRWRRVTLKWTNP
ncbi:hypothetical protein RRG08_063438 [Elysia crispata]|uniref:Uncharacterized protein n=1 Tax=Elysia crispata TaxID=231223 RepID=A0AAE1ABU3_9GAST|nr:hypothetical protein RRG08_063438 [Elysia crispata]